MVATEVGREFDRLHEVHFGGFDPSPALAVAARMSVSLDPEQP